MKKHLLLLLSLLLTTTMLFAERVSQSDAATVASNFLNGAVTSTKKSKAVTPNRMTLKTAAAASESQYYVYENPDGGWVMVSASDVLQPILAYSKTGSFSFDNQPDNVKKWLGKYEDLIKKVEADGVEASAEASAQWNALKKSLPDDPAGTVIVGPLVQTTWNQGKPYDYYTPGTGSYGSGTKAAVGCVATAMAQVMNYWQWPVNGTGSHKYQPEMDIWEENESTGEYEYKETIVIFEGELEADFENTTYQWAKMKNSYSSNYNADPDRAVATLMYHCGIAVDMQYGGSDYDGSGAQTINYNDDDELCAQNALWKYFRYKKDGLVSYKRDGYTYNGTKYYNSWSDAAWTAMVKEELDKQHPIMYDGSGTGGHSFICDGYDSKDYFHFNWGWSGSNDGWYKLNNLVPGSGGAGGGSYSFSEDQGVIIGIVPDKPDEDLYILGEVEGNGYNWDPSKGAKMNFANNVFTLTTRIKGTGGYGFLSFTTALASGSSAWDEIASSRLGADASDKLVSSGSTYNLTTNYDNAFKFADGIWTITVDLENKKMTAVKPTTYTVTWNNSGTEKQVEFVKDAALELPAAPAACDNGKVFVGWTEATSVNADAAPDDLFTKAGTKTVTKNITYNAVFATPTSGGSGAGWELVTDASTLKEGDVLVIASNSKGKTAGEISNSIMAEVESTFEGTDLQSLGDGTVELTLGGSEGAWTLTSSEGSLGATAVKKVAWDNGTTTWSISISDNNATIQNGTEAYGRFLHNVGSNRFTTYTSNTTTAMLLPQLYRKAGGYADYSLGCGTITPVSTEWTITLVDVPEDWGSTINLYAWDNDLNPLNGDWPGTAMIANRGTTYTATLTVYGSNPVVNIIFNNGSLQTQDIENAVSGARYRVNNATIGGKYTANAVYKVSLADVTNGEISGLNTWNAAGENVSFTATPSEGYTLSSVTVKEDESGNAVSVADGKFTMPAADVTLTAVFAKESAKVTVTWNDRGTETPVEFSEDDALVLPAAPADCSGTNGKKFVGWTAESTLDGSKPADLFTTAGGKTVEADITYYAVFATGSGSGSASVAKATSIAEGDQMIFVCEDVSKELTSFSSTSTVYGIGSDYTDSPAGEMTFDVAAGSADGTYSFKNGDNYVNWTSGNSLKTSTTLDANSSWKVSFDENGNATLANAGDENRVIWWNVSSPRFACYTGKTAGTSYNSIQLYKVTTGGGYSNYSLDCEGGSVDPEEVNLTPTDAQAWYYADYSTSGSHNWVMNFADGDIADAQWTFNMQIEVNTASANALAGSYDENDGVVIGEPDETHTVLMNGLTTIEGKEVSLKLTYNSKDAAGNPTYDVVISFLGDDGKRYKINKEALAIIAKDVDSEELIDLYGDTGTPLTKHEIVYYTCGEQWTTQSYYDGDILWFPSNPPAQNGKAFVGWTTTEHHTSATAPTFVEEGTAVHASANYHAVYK